MTHSLEMLNRMIPELGIRSITDIPCGDFNWIPELLEAYPSLDYIGYDVVSPLILENQKRYPDRQFAVLDITTEVPRRSDLIFCKDLLNHLCIDDVWAALSNMVASGSPYLMITNNTGFENEELQLGVPHASRYLNLFAEPFHMPEPVYSDHYIVVWNREALARRLQEKLG